MISILVPALVGAIFYSKLIRSVRVLSILVGLTLLIEVAARVLFEYGINNMFIFHLYSFIEFGFIALIYYQVSTNPHWRKLILTLSVLFGTFSIVNILFLEKITEFNSIQRHVELIGLAIILVIYCYKLIHEDRNVNFFQNPFFILTGGFLIYFGGTMYLFVFSKELLNGDKTSYWIIHGIFNIFLNITYTVVLWKGRIRL
jgi:hypothetical protein